MKTARSRIIISKNYALEKEGVNLRLYIWRGDILDQPNEPTYSFTKQRASAQTAVEYFDIAEYVRSEQSDVFDVMWVVTETEFLDETNVESQTFLANYSYSDRNYIDNFIAMDEAIRYIPMNQNGRVLYLRNNNSTYDNIHVNDSTTINITETDNSNQVVSDYIVSDFVRDVAKVQLRSGTTVKHTYYFKRINEFRNTPIMVEFLNKYGAGETMWFFRGFEESLNIERQDQYYNDPLNGNADAKYIEGNIKSRKSITLSTGFIHESANKIIQQLLSTQLVSINNTPANVDTNSLDIKTRKKDKLIEYDLDFKFSFDAL